ncbi:unnamed protein product, partial [Brenthis ino]
MNKVYAKVGYRIYDPVKNLVTTSRDVVILEKKRNRDTVMEESVVKLEPFESSSSESDYRDVEEENVDPIAKEQQDK